jgi:hypothetical protein
MDDNNNQDRRNLAGNIIVDIARLFANRLISFRRSHSAVVSPDCNSHRASQAQQDVEMSVFSVGQNSDASSQKGVYQEGDDNTDTASINGGVFLDLQDPDTKELRVNSAKTISAKSAQQQGSSGIRKS